MALDHTFNVTMGLAALLFAVLHFAAFAFSWLVFIFQFDLSFMSLECHGPKSDFLSTKR